MPSKDVKGMGAVNEANDPPKRKRGRPRKNEPKDGGIVNEGNDKIIMDKSTPKPQIGVVTPVKNVNTTDSTSVSKMSNDEYERLSIQQVQRRWAQVFSKYSSVMDAGDFQTVMYGGANNGSSSNYIRNNPFLNNQRVKQIVAEGRNIQANEVDDYIEDPVNNERNLQEVSWALYYQSMIYMHLLKMERDVPLFNYFITPENMDASEYTKEAYKKEKKKVDSALRVLKPKVTFKDMIIQIENEGKIAMLPRISYDDKQAFFWTWQKIPSQFFRIVGFGSTEHFVIMLDMSMFLNPMYDVAQFPPFIGEKWREMIGAGIIEEDEKTHRYNVSNQYKHGIYDILEFDSDTWHYWYRLPQDMCFVFSADGSHPLMIPDMSGIMPDIADLSSYKLAQQTALSNAITSVLTAEVPMADNLISGKDQTAISSDTVLGFTDLFESKVGRNIMAFFSPFQNYQLLSLSQDIEPATTIVSNRIKDVINTSGMSGLINLDSKPSVAAIKTAQLIAEAKSKLIVSQFENAVNRILNESFELKYKWKVHFWGGAFTFENDMKLMKEMILSGCKELLPRFLSGYEMDLEDYASIHNMIDALGIKIIKDELIYSLEEGRKTQIEALGVKNAVQLGDTSKAKVGRPAMDDNDVENDSTSDSKSAGNDVSETKSDYAKKADNFDRLKKFVEEFVGTDLDEDEVINVLSEELENIT